MTFAISLYPYSSFVKQCSQCRIVKPKSHFHRKSGNKTRSACKTCTELKKKVYRLANRDKIKEYNDTYYAQNRDGLIEKKKEYQKKNRKSYLARRRELRQENPEPHRKRFRQWQKENKDYVNRKNKRRWHERRDLPGSHTEVEWQALLVKVGYKCVCCGFSDSSLADCGLARDHIIPATWEASTNNIDNIQPLCAGCNGKKSNKHSTNYMLRRKSTAAPVLSVSSHS